MPCRIEDFTELVAQLPDVKMTDHGRFAKYEITAGTFAYLWHATSTVGLKQTIAEQLALVGERPDVFEVQYTSGAFGWVVVHLERLERDELAELTFEAWRLTAPSALIDDQGDKLPE